MQAETAFMFFWGVYECAADSFKWDGDEWVIQYYTERGKIECSLINQLSKANFKYQISEKALH